MTWKQKRFGDLGLGEKFYHVPAWEICLCGYVKEEGGRARLFIGDTQVGEVFIFNEEDKVWQL